MRKQRPNTKQLRAIIERERTVHWWGRDCLCSPKFVAQRFGNGKRLLMVQPLNTRPHYYVLRIDDRWDLSGDRFIDDHLDDIKDAIEDEWGEKERERGYLIEDMAEQGIVPGDPRYNDDLAGNEDRLDWPAASWDSGCGWDEMDWPRRAELERLDAK